MAELIRKGIGAQPLWRKEDWTAGATVHKWNYYRYLNSTFVCLTEGTTNAPGAVVDGVLTANDGWKLVFDGYASVANAEAAVAKANTAAEGLTQLQTGLFAIVYDDGEFKAVTNAENSAFESGEITEDGEIVLTFNC